jgi:hypothetical protein
MAFLTSGQVIISNSTFGCFLTAAALAAVGVAAGACANAVPIESAITGIVESRRCMADSLCL